MGYAWRRFDAGHPEWWIAVVSMIGWLVLVAVHSHTLASAVPMALAMMLPLAIPLARLAAFRSKWDRRHRAMAFFAAAYVAVWIVAGACLHALAGAFLAGAGIPVALAVAGAAGVAALWQFTSIKQWSVRACHRTRPLAPKGWKADQDCLAFGARQGCACLASCWALMLVSASLHGPLVAIPVALLCGLERFAFKPPTRFLGFNLMALAVAIAALGLALR